MPHRTHPLRRLIAALGFLLALLFGLSACQKPGLPEAALTPPSSGEAQEASPTSLIIFPTPSATVAVNSASPESIAEAVTDTPQPPVVETQTPTEASTPTVTATWDGTPSRTPTKTLTPTRTRWPSRTPSITPTPTPPLAWVRINKPGPYSKVSSPIHVEAVINPGDDGLVHVEIIGEDGQVLHREDLDFRNYRERHLAVAPDISFDLVPASETARLVLYSIDQFDRIIYLASVDLVLMKVGDDDVTLPGSLDEPYIIRSPHEDDVVKGGVLQLTGLARLVNDQPLIVELTDEQGNVVGGAETTISQPYGNLSHVPFTILVPYTVSGTTPVRLSLRQESAGRIPGTVFLYSTLLILEP